MATSARVTVSFGWLRGGALALFAIGAAPHAMAQSAPDANAHAIPDDNQVLLPSLKGLRFVDAVAKVDANGSAIMGVTVDGPNILYSPGILQRLQAFIGKPLVKSDLQRITKTVSDWYATRNRPYVDVEFPEQDVSTGVLQVVVTEFRAGNIKVKGNGWFSSSLILSDIRLQPGDPIDARKLNDDVAYLNQSDFRDVRIVLEKSDKIGATDLVVETNDSFPLRFSAGYANNGTPVVGRDRWNAGITWGNAFWLDQQISYQFTSSTDFWLHPTDVPVELGKSEFADHSGSWTIPLPWRDRIIFFGDYAQVRPDLGPDLGDVGTNWQASVRYDAPITLKNWPLQEVQLGFDFKRSNNNLEFGGFQISNSQTDIDQFVLSYGTAIPDSWGQTKFSDRLAYSPGDLSSFNNDIAFQPSQTHSGTPYAKANYVYNDFSVNRLTRLPADIGLVTRLEAQYSSANLLPSERLAAGGADSVRGYDPYAASGTIGYLFSQEVRSPVYTPLADLFGSKSIDDKLQFDAFYDFGYVRDRFITPGDKRSYYLDSAGAGFQYAVGRYLSLKIDYGFRLRKLSGVSKGGLVQATVTLSN
ncbi:MAG TPA: ShlB/FhaC/HecB family hemolysin secretion/activation protein [Rhizomicrobium sp.]|nr:ShlB/FhaC/HecB family hemolysin secretion/activation protein [Rhizomicrobium sp.]